MTIKDCVIDSCGGGVAMDGGHAVVDGLTVTNTPVAFDLKGGARVDARNIVHRPGGAGGGKKQRSRRGRAS